MYILAGGFASYLLGLNRTTYELSGGVGSEGNNPNAIKEPGFGWMTAFLVVVCFVGLFVLIPLRKVLLLYLFFCMSKVLDSMSSLHIVL